MMVVIVHAKRVGLATERPYEDALYRMALDVNAAPWPGAAALWSEHPLFSFWVLRCVDRFSSGSKMAVDATWALIFMFAFIAALLFSWSGPPTSAEDTGLRPAQTAWLRAVLVLAAFLSPLTVVAAIRSLPDAIAFLALGGVLLSAHSFYKSSSWSSSFAFAGSLSVLSLSHVYGLFVAAGILFGSCIVASDTRERAVVLKLLLVVVLLAGTTIIDGAANLRRWRLLRNHYWAESILKGAPPLPLAGVWYAGSEFTSGAPRLASTLQGVVGAVLLAILFCSSDKVSRVGAWASLSVCAILWVFQCATGDRIVVYHWLGLLWILVACTVARALDGWKALAAALVAVVVVLIPGLASATMTPPNGPASLKAAAEEIHRLSKDADAIVFGGTRAFILFEPELDHTLLQRSFVYLRQEHHPDSFIGRRLIPKARLVPDNQWAAFRRRRIVLVLVEAAQKIGVPTRRWVARTQRCFVHNAYSISLITIELLDERPLSAHLGP
jgi:hypothetical protein